MTPRLLAVTGLLVVLSLWTHGRSRAADTPRFDFAAAVPLAFGEWIGRDAPPLDPDVARVLAADQYVHRYYGYRVANRQPRLTDDGSRPSMNSGRPEPVEGRVADVETDIAYYARPQAGAAMHSPLNCLPGNGWQVIAGDTVPVTYGTSTATARRIVVARDADRLVMTYWFQNRGALVGNEYRQRLQLLTNGMQGSATDAALVRVMAADTPDGHAAMRRFASALATLLAASFN